jgi:hypothetical protein
VVIHKSTDVFMQRFKSTLRQHWTTLSSKSLNTSPSECNSDETDSPKTDSPTEGMSCEEFASAVGISILPDDLQEYSPTSPPPATFRSLNDVSHVSSQNSSNNNSTTSSRDNSFIKLDMAIFIPPTPQEQHELSIQSPTSPTSRERSKSESALETQFVPVVLTSSLHTCPLPKSKLRAPITRRAKVINAGRFTVTKLEEISDMPSRSNNSSPAEFCHSPSRFTLERGDSFEKGDPMSYSLGRDSGHVVGEKL